MGHQCRILRVDVPVDRHRSIGFQRDLEPEDEDAWRKGVGGSTPSFRAIFLATVSLDCLCPLGLEADASRSAYSLPTLPLSLFHLRSRRVRSSPISRIPLYLLPETKASQPRTQYSVAHLALNLNLNPNPAHEPRPSSVTTASGSSQSIRIQQVSTITRTAMVTRLLLLERAF